VTWASSPEDVALLLSNQLGEPRSCIETCPHLRRGALAGSPVFGG